MEKARIERRFGCRGLNPEDLDAHTKVRVLFKDAARALNDLIRDGREKSIAFTKLEEAMVWSLRSFTPKGPKKPNMLEFLD